MVAVATSESMQKVLWSLLVDPLCIKRLYSHNGNYRECAPSRHLCAQLCFVNHMLNINHISGVEREQRFLIKYLRKRYLKRGLVSKAFLQVSRADGHNEHSFKFWIHEKNPAGRTSPTDLRTDGEPWITPMPELCTNLEMCMSRKNPMSVGGFSSLVSDRSAT
jgi:hypothetical protein